MKKTYAEKKGKETFDWNNFLAQPNYWPAMLAKARKLSSEWVTCACGNQCSVIDRKKGGEPKDKELLELGIDFMMDIEKMESAERVAEGMASHAFASGRVQNLEDYYYLSKELYSKNLENAREEAIITLEKIEQRASELINIKRSREIIEINHQP